jgi:GNAT superfamily N-acetyltransferase
MPSIDFRPFCAADMDVLLRLKAAAGWNQLAPDWRRLLDLAPGGCFMALADGEPAGTGTGITYEGVPPAGRTGWIGMVLVDPARRRQGIGTAILGRVTRHLREERACAAIRLDATPLGKTLYDKLGFREEYRLERKLRPASAAPAGAAPAFPPVAPADLDALAAFDAGAFRCDRGPLLRRLVAEGPLFSALARDGEGRIAGYLLARPGSAADFLGPWVARDGASAGRLLDAALAALGGRPLFVDVPLPNASAAELTARRGFAAQRELIRMRLGGAGALEDARATCGSAGPELG